MTHGVTIPVTGSSQVGEARRIAAGFAERGGYSEAASGAVALVVTEAGNNLVRHGGGGEIVLQSVPADTIASSTGSEASYGVQILALDRGPGIRNIAESLRDGHSMGGTAGEGLGAIKRASSLFDIYSIPGQGTAVLSRVPSVSAAPGQAPGQYGSLDPLGLGMWEIGVVSLAMSGEIECGDSWAMKMGRPLAHILIADGLGHGPLAAEASREATRIFSDLLRRDPSTTPDRVMNAIHGALRSTRGAAASLAEIDLTRQIVRFAGVGNVAGAVASSTGAGDGGMRIMVSHNGTLGAQVHRIQEFEYPLPVSGLLILASDGLSANWHLDRYPGLLRRHPALIAGVLYRDCCRNRDDATVVVVRSPAGKTPEGAVMDEIAHDAPETVPALAGAGENRL